MARGAAKYREYFGEAGAGCIAADVPELRRILLKEKPL
jgi:hypothetical protein